MFWYFDPSPDWQELKEDEVDKAINYNILWLKSPIIPLNFEKFTVVTV